MPQGIMRHLRAGRFALLEDHCSLWIVAPYNYRGKTKSMSPAIELSQLQADPRFRQPLLFAPPLILIYLLQESIWQQIWLEKLLRLKVLSYLISLHCNLESILKILVLNHTSTWTLSAAPFYLKHLTREFFVPTQPESRTTSQTAWQKGGSFSSQSYLYLLGVFLWNNTWGLLIHQYGRLKYRSQYFYSFYLWRSLSKVCLHVAINPTCCAISSLSI